MKKQTKKQQQHQFKEYLRQLFPDGNLTKIRQWAGKLNIAIRQRKIEGVVELEALTKLILGDVYKQSGKAARRSHVRDMAKTVRTLSDVSAEISANNPNMGYCIVPAPETLAKAALPTVKRMSAKSLYHAFYLPGWRTTHAFISFTSNGNVEEAREMSRILISDGARRKSFKRISGWTNAGLIDNGKKIPLLKEAA